MPALASWWEPIKVREWKETSMTMFLDDNMS